MMTRDLRFLLECRVFSSRELESTVKEVLFVLRHNRTRHALSVEHVEIGNGFIIAALELSQMDPTLQLEIPKEDLDYIIEENQLLHMGSARN